MYNVSYVINKYISNIHLESIHSFMSSDNIKHKQRVSNTVLEAFNIVHLILSLF